MNSSSEPQYKNLYRNILSVRLNLLSNCRLNSFRITPQVAKNILSHKLLLLFRDWIRKYEPKEGFVKLEFWFYISIINNSQLMFSVYTYCLKCAFYLPSYVGSFSSEENPIKLYYLVQIAVYFTLIQWTH